MRYVLYTVLVLCAVPLAFSTLTILRERQDFRTLAPTSGSFVHAKDIDLFVQDSGAGRAVIFLHGMASWGGTWRDTIAELSANYRVITVDMPPFGFSERPWDRTYWRVTQAERLNELIKNLKLEKVLVVAHSYGARAALELAMKYPESIHALIVVDPALDGIYGTPAVALSGIPVTLLNIGWLRFATVSSTMTNPLLSRTLLSAFMYKKHAATDEILALYRAPAARQSSTIEFGYWLVNFLTGADRGLSSEPENYEKLQVPVGIIWGREDTTTPLAQGEALHKMIRASSFDIIEGVGHMPQIEDPVAFNSVLKKVLTLHQ